MEWKSGDKILTTAGTGKGKSYLVKNILFNYADDGENKILFLVNRLPLKEQIQHELKESGKENVIIVQTYQKLEADILAGEADVSGYKYIICDEAHYFFSDATFNHRTNLGLNYIKSIKGSIVIFMSATPTMLKSYFKIKDSLVYELKNDYEYIKNIYVYSSRQAICQRLNSIPKGEKAIYFGSAKNAYEISLEVNEAKFVCSKSNELYSRLSSKEELVNIQEKSKFSCRVLCSTTALDNGINILDPEVKHIVVDLLDIETIIQCIGRKRVENANDQITLYIANKDYRQINIVVEKKKKALEQPIYLRDYGEQCFREKYFKCGYDKNLIDITKDEILINEAGAWKYARIVGDFGRVLVERTPWYKYVLKEMGIPKRTILFLEQEMDSTTLIDYLSGIKGIKIFKEQKEEIKSFILKSALGKIQKNQKKLGLNSINAILKDLKLPYQFISKKESQGEHRGKNYWILVEGCSNK